MKIAIHIPAFKRLGLLETVLHNLWLIERELGAEGIRLKVWVAGDEGEKQQTAIEWHDATYVQVANNPLGGKVNKLIRSTVGWCSDAYVGLGSDDLVTAQMFRHWAKLLDDGVDFMGVRDMYAFKPATGELVYWPGYEGPRIGESIGLGRCISNRLMMRLGHEPFAGNINSSLDGSMTAKMEEFRHEYKFATARIKDVGPVVDIKTTIGFNVVPDGKRMDDAWQSMSRWFGPGIEKMLLDLTPEGESVVEPR